MIRRFFDLASAFCSSTHQVSFSPRAIPLAPSEPKLSTGQFLGLFFVLGIHFLSVFYYYNKLACHKTTFLSESLSIHEIYKNLRAFYTRITQWGVINIKNKWNNNIINNN
jgi:hypothetical protein